MAHRWRRASVRAIAAHRRRAGWAPYLRGPAGDRLVRLQPEEKRSRPRCAGDLSREGGKRTVTCALPGEAVIEHEHLIGSTLPFSNQPGSRFQLGTRTYPPLWAVIELLSKSTKLALPLRAEAAESDFLHSVCHSSQQKLAAEVRRSFRFVENAPLLTKLAEAELGEAQERLPAPAISPLF